MSLVTPAGPWPTADMLAVLRVRIGLAADDVTKDAEIIAAWTIVTSWVETYLDRWLVPGTYEEVFTHIARRVLSLKAYPVTSIASMVGEMGVQVLTYHIEKDTGLVHMDGFLISHELAVTYVAVPNVDGALFIAMVGVFDLIWSDLTVTTPAGEDAPVKAISSNGARVEFDLSSGGMEIHSGSGLPASLTYVLNLYRRLSC